MLTTDFSPSINIVRDTDKAIYYLPTNNAKRINLEIAQNFSIGIRSFNIVGSYGTGKSAFLWAFQQNLTQSNAHFEIPNGAFNQYQNFTFQNIVGSYKSILDEFAEFLESKPKAKTVIKSLKAKCKVEQKVGNYFVIIIDEFGKFLEYAAKNNPDEDLYFIQQVAELANDKANNLLFITTLHQNFDAYAQKLTKEQREEWQKVKGRLKELTFNEPVEQLLLLASSHIAKLGITSTAQPNQALFQIVKKNGISTLSSDLTNDIIQKLYPFDCVSAVMLTKALQRYAQNERSLFTFLLARERHGLYQHINTQEDYYHVGHIYNYIYHNYYSTIKSRENEDYFKWSRLQDSLERVDVEFDEDDMTIHALIIKVIGLIDILTSDAAKINFSFLETYFTHILGISNIDLWLDKLNEKQIIRYLSFKDTYKLFEGTDFDIEGELATQRTITDENIEVATELKELSPLDVAIARKVSFQKGTPRYFKYQFTKNPKVVFDETETDGYINLIFNEGNILDIVTSIKNQPILYGIFKEAKHLRQQIFEIKVTRQVLKLAGGDKVAVRELKLRLSELVLKIKTYLYQTLFTPNQNIAWYFKGKQITINNRTQFNKQLSIICEVIYPNTPILRNELINRHKLPGAIGHARNQYIEHLVNHYEHPELSFPKDKFPPEKSIYASLLKKTGIHQEARFGKYTLQRPTDPSFQQLWEVSENFLDKAKYSKKSLLDFMDSLSKPPLKLKQGVIDFWIPTFLFIKRSTFSLFYDGIYTAELTPNNLQLIVKGPQKCKIKTLNIEGNQLDLFNKYRDFAKQVPVLEATQYGVLETIKPFLSFYRKLPLYTKKTNKELSDDAITLRKIITNTKDPEQMFFEQLPTGFGYTLKELEESEETTNEYIDRLQESVLALNDTYDKLLVRFEQSLLAALNMQGESYEKCVEAVKKRYKNLKFHLLVREQKTLYNRLVTPVRSKEAWLNSIAFALLRKDLTKITDKEEDKIHQIIKERFRELDNLLAINQLEIDETKEEAYHIEITCYPDPPKDKPIIVTKTQSKEVEALQGKVEAILKATNNKIAGAVLIKLLKKMLIDDKS